MVNDVRAALCHFVDLFAGDATFGEVLCGAAGRDDAEASGNQQAGDFAGFVFVFIFDGDEDGTARVGQAFARAAHGFVEGFGEGGAKTHDFAGRFHFRAQNGVNVVEFGKGKDGFFDGKEGRADVARNALRSKGLPGHAARGDFGEWPACCFGDEGHGA